MAGTNTPVSQFTNCLSSIHPDGDMAYTASSGSLKYQSLYRRFFDLKIIYGARRLPAALMQFPMYNGFFHCCPPISMVVLHHASKLCVACLDHQKSQFNQNSTNDMKYFC